MEATRRGQPIGVGRVNPIKVDATTDADTRLHMIEDGLDPANPLAGFQPVVSVQSLRKRTGLSQEKFAAALRIPVATLRNWEQGRAAPEPAVQSLLKLVADDPERAFRVLGS